MKLNQLCIIVDWFGTARFISVCAKWWTNNKQTNKQFNERLSIARTQLESIPNYSTSWLVEDFCSINTANEAFSFCNIHQNVRWLLETKGDETKQDGKKRDATGKDQNCSLRYFTPVYQFKNVSWHNDWIEGIVREQKHRSNIIKGCVAGCALSLSPH